MMSEPVFHPVQDNRNERFQALDSEITLRAYEVYSHVFGPQPAMIDLEGRNCRGGFGLGEIIAFLYARSFPKEEWSRRVDQALQGMKRGRGPVW
jgi:hypothetical protein